MSAAERLAPVLAEIADGAVARERDRELPWEAVRALRESGFTALRLPVTVGGGGASLTEFFDVLVELARADSNLPQLLRGHIAFVEHVLASPEGEWRSRWLARLADGEILGNAQSEPGGSAFWRPSTRITRGDNGWQVDGRKFYSTGSLFADWIYTSGADGDDFVSALVRGDGEGVERIDDWDGFGQRLTGSGTTVFTAARADAEDVTVHERGERPPSIEAAVFQLVLLA
ncbi:MAG: acyl-CoA dehydrogenase family protein, partial [Actinomycetota bacterium]|nr:acyl-CoA dehydrogenase family protein [Actinomycetota bacterium]